ncbi:TetR/AcrR family transcriptional regulator [Pelosinus sp. sgz500959]|uniref:TetR/AcrR family transcriptional regulator n=1 Tax=Pelosinus sp. sgz500959 TaxID=3242472 RepID=UPI0036725591
MSQHAPMRQQILTIALTTFNQYGNALTIDQLTVRLSFSPSSLHPYFNSKPELIRQLVSFILTRIRQPPLPFSHRSLTDELQDLLATYRELFTAFSQNALSDLKRHYVDTKLVQIMTDEMLLGPFRQAPPSLAELLDILLFGIARRAP